MNRILTLTGVALATLALAACSPGINEGIGHRITFDSSGMVIHATGKPDAHIGKNGSLAIADRAIDVTPAQRQLLQRYYQEAHDTMDSGKAIGRQGVQMATHSIGAAIRSIFHGDSASADKQLDAQSQQIESAANTLCTDVKALGATQQAIATGIPAFKPYVSGARTECKITRTTTVTAGRTVTVTSRTYTMKESGGTNATTPDASSLQTSKPGQPDTSSSSQP